MIISPIEEKQYTMLNGHFTQAKSRICQQYPFFTASVFGDLYPESNYQWAIYVCAAILPAATFI